MKQGRERDNETMAAIPQFCGCGKRANLVRPVRHPDGYSVPGSIPICWTCWDKVRAPNWHDKITGRVGA